ncbi:MAG: carboxymuconolactone decarboxylase family protein [Lawsonibacter sp.]|nr:carboxymuconolactone decarboxylase family protein [Lawsonibacter sp.]
MKEPSAVRTLYTPREAYVIYYRAVRMMPSFFRAKKRGVLRDDFIERLMLAVTEVNGCAMCSYAHTKMALESGMSIGEIENLLSGDRSDVPPEELPAVLFAQHYADSRGRPSKEAWRSAADFYGEAKSLAILGAIRIIMLGNAYGIPAGSLIRRMSPKRSVDPRSGIGYELVMLLSSVVFFPFVVLQALGAKVLHISPVNF